jgi:DNA-binding CsgD family transcriptional regulator
LALGVEALAAAWQGAESLCRERAESAAALRPKLETLVLGEYTDALGHLELSKENYETAVAHLDHPKRDPRTGLADLRDWSSGELAEALIRLGRPLPIEMAERASSYADSNVTSGAALACRLQGIQALEEFSLFFERSAAAFREASCPTEQARTLLCHAERLRRAGEKVAARELLQAAQATFEACGARIWARRTAQELAATGLHLQRSHQPTQTLTPQEHQVATLVAQGATNKDVALALFISAKTVEAHLSRVYRKLGVNRRSQLAHRFTPQAAALPGGRQ